MNSNAQDPSGVFDLARGTWGTDPATGKAMAYFRDVPLIAKLPLVAGQMVYNFFTQGYDSSIGTGAAAYNITNADTNMKDTRVPASELWYLFAVRMGIEPFRANGNADGQNFGWLPSAQAWAYALDNAWVKMSVEQQEWFRFPASRFLSGAKAPIEGLPAGEAGADMTFFQVNNPVFDGVVEFLDRVNAFNGKFGGYAPYILEKNTSFQFTVEFTARAADALGFILSQLNNGSAQGNDVVLAKFGPEFARNVVGLVAV